MGRALEDWMRLLPPRLEGADGERAKDMLLEQHVRMRVVLDELDRYALAVIRAGSRTRPDLAAALEVTSTWLTEHMSEEEHTLERLLAPTSEASAALAQLRDDHARQRDELCAICRVARAPGDAITLALAVRGFVSDARLDLDSEDRRFLSDDESSEPRR